MVTKWWTCSHKPVSSTTGVQCFQYLRDMEDATESSSLGWTVVHHRVCQINDYCFSRNPKGIIPSWIKVGDVPYFVEFNINSAPLLTSPCQSIWVFGIVYTLCIPALQVVDQRDAGKLLHIIQAHALPTQWYPDEWKASTGIESLILGKLPSTHCMPSQVNQLLLSRSGDRHAHEPHLSCIRTGWNCASSAWRGATDTCCCHTMMKSCGESALWDDQTRGNAKPRCRHCSLVACTALGGDTWCKFRNLTIRLVVDVGTVTFSKSS